MASAPKHCIALDNELNEAPWGKLFIDPASGKTFNLNNVEAVSYTHLTLPTNREV